MCVSYSYTHSHLLNCNCLHASSLVCSTFFPLQARTIKALSTFPLIDKDHIITSHVWAACIYMCACVCVTQRGWPSASLPQGQLCPGLSGRCTPLCWMCKLYDVKSLFGLLSVLLPVASSYCEFMNLLYQSLLSPCGLV